LLLVELLGVVNQPAGSALAALALNGFIVWLKSIGAAAAVNSGDASKVPIVVVALLRVLGSTVNDTTSLGAILEETLEAHFACSGK